MDRAKISLLAANCTTLSLPRPRLLARLLGERFEVEVVAPVFPGDVDVYATASWPGKYTPVPARPWPGFARSLGDLVDAANGDLIYACKPRATSFGVALLARRQRRRPVVVDVDDREIYHCYPYSYHLSKNLLLSYREWRHPNAYPLTLAMEKLISRAGGVTSVSSYFQGLFGGAIVPQAVDTERLNPDRYDREALRRQWDLDRYGVVLFLGRPLPHKGLEEIAAAVQRSRHPHARLVVVPPVGAPASGGYVDLLRGLDRVVCLDPQPHELVPAFLAMADVVMTPQRSSPISLGQMPTKIPEAMAMGVPVVVTAISDLPEQVGDGGLVVRPGDVGALTEALDQVLGDRELARAMGAAGRNRAVARYSLDAVRPEIERVFADAC